MDKIFAVVDKTGREIHLSKERWLHVRLEHPKITDYEEIENAVKNHPLKWMACLVLEHAQELFLLHQESSILECYQDLKNLEVSRTKVGSLRKNNS